MMGAGKKSEFGRKVVDQSTLWMARIERGLSDSEKEEFERWLAEKPENEACFFEHQVAWASFDVMDQWKPAYSGPPNPDLFDPKAGRRWNGFLFYGGMAALLAIGIWFTASNYSREEDSPLADSSVYKSSTYEKHFLSDGSSFYLLPNSEVRVAFSEDERAIEFVQGESHFTVAQDPDRPFIVQSEVGRVTALGTVFSVKQDAASWEVFVTEGRVKVDEARSSTPFSKVKTFSAELVAGQKVVQELDDSEFTPKVESYSESELIEKLAWKDQIIDMVSAPLVEILSEFERFGNQEVVIVDEELKMMRMTVAIKADNLRDFIDLLELTADVAAAENPDGSIWLTRSTN